MKERRCTNWRKEDPRRPLQLSLDNLKAAKRKKSLDLSVAPDRNKWERQPFAQYREFSNNCGCPTMEYAAPISNVSL